MESNRGTSEIKSGLHIVLVATGRETEVGLRTPHHLWGHTRGFRMTKGTVTGRHSRSRKDGKKADMWTTQRPCVYLEGKGRTE